MKFPYLMKMMRKNKLIFLFKEDGSQHQRYLEANYIFNTIKEIYLENNFSLASKYELFFIKF